MSTVTKGNRVIAGIFSIRYLIMITAFSLLLIGGWLIGGAMIEAVSYYWDDIAYLGSQHIELALISGSISILFSIPVGIILSRPFFAGQSENLLQFLNILSTFPSLAVIALSMTFLGIGAMPAILALFLVTLLPIVRNTYSGLLKIPTHLKEAAYGMGMSHLQTLIKVEIPNALPVIIAGIRTAMVINIGTVPLAFLVGGGGLGELIFTGIAIDENAMLLAGTIPTAIIAIIGDLMIGLIALILISKGVNHAR